MDYGKALTFIFEDSRWIAKIAIGIGLLIAGALIAIVIFGVGLIALIPFAGMTEGYDVGPAIGFGFLSLIFCLMALAGLAYLAGFLIVRGYTIRLLQNVRDGLLAPLPEWNQWSGDLVRGVKSVVVNIVWGLPFLIVFIPFFCIIPAAVLNTVNGGQPDGPAIFGMQAAIWCMIPATMLVQILYQVFAPGFTIAFAQHERVGDGLRFPTLIRWTWGNIRQVGIVALVVFGVAYAINTIAATVGMILCFVGLLVAVPAGALFASLYTHHLYGQLAAAHPPVGLTELLVPLSEPTAPPSEAAEESVPFAPPATPAEDEPPPVA